MKGAYYDNWVCTMALIKVYVRLNEAVQLPRCLKVIPCEGGSILEVKSRIDTTELM